MRNTFYSNGKLLLTGEYVILDGAKGLALPAKYGQNLVVAPAKHGELVWRSYDADGTIWFEGRFAMGNFAVLQSTDKNVSKALSGILSTARRMNQTFLLNQNGVAVETHLDFSRNWGLGSSSTLVNNVAQWARIDAYDLLEATFGGSGYDIACAQRNTPLFYRLERGKGIVESTQFEPSFKDALFFIYLNRKQNSRQAIKAYRSGNFDKIKLIYAIDELTTAMHKVRDLREFEQLIEAHESLLSEALRMKRVQEGFSDYFGKLKSLGAWGGDFILATGNEKTPDYFKAKGFETVIPFREMIF